MSDSASLFRQACEHIPGGVNSPVRAFRGVGGDPVFMKSAHGCRMTDVSDRSYIDYIGSWGPMIAGHSHPHVIEAVVHAVQSGLSFGTPTEVEVTMADRLCEIVPNLDQVRMVNSGTEACMSAIRLARGATGRDRIIKFTGCYHGHADAFLVKAGSGALTLGLPNSPGVPSCYADLTLSLDFNNLEQVAEVMQDVGDEIAAIIVEPVAGNMNCIPPDEGFLEGLRSLCDQYGSLLIFDEVMTGFRLAAGGAQERYQVRADLVTYGKIIGGGMPVGAFGGRRDIMQQIAPTGPVYQAGTLSGNPVAMAAGLATLELISADGFYESLESKSRALIEGIQAAANQAGIALTCNRVGAMFGLFFSNESRVHRYDQVVACDDARFRQFFHAMLDRGVYLAPSSYEAGFLSQAHSMDDIQLTIEAAAAAFADLAA